MEKIMEEMIKGRDWANQLRSLIQVPYSDDVAVSQQKELAEKISGSLTEAIYMINGGSCENSGEVFQIPASSGDQRSVDSSQSCKRLAVKDRRGGYKRRKSSDSWTNISSSMVDEYAWRKYGQKQILHTTFPRCYFRCTHKHDQGCKATKQVQRIQGEPPKYQITYFGHHTCRKTKQPNFGDIILDSYRQESNLISFQSNTPSDVYPSPSCPNAIKEENKELELQSDLILEEFPPLDSICLPDLDGDFLPGVYNSYASSFHDHSMDLDFFSKCDDIRNYLESLTRVV